jgi:hypothetical protein
VWVNPLASKQINRCIAQFAYRDPNSARTGGKIVIFGRAYAAFSLSRFLFLADDEAGFVFINRHHVGDQSSGHGKCGPVPVASAQFPLMEGEYCPNEEIGFAHHQVLLLGKN